MLKSWWLVLAPQLALSVNVLVQIIACRFNPRAGLLRSIIWGGVVGFLGLIIFDSAIVSQWSRLLTHIITYVAFSYGYFHFLNLGETARRIRILRELGLEPQGLTLEGLLKRYNAAEIIERRLGRLVHNGQLIIVNGRYYTGKPLMLWVAKFMQAVKKILLGRKRKETAPSECSG